MKKVILFAALFVLSTMAWAQDKQSRSVEPFDYVSFGISGDLIIKQGNTFEVILEGDEEDLDKIETEVSSNKLRIRNKNNNWNWNWNSGKIKVTVTLKEFTGLDVSGSGDAESVGVLKGEDVRLSVSGSGDMDIRLNAKEVDMSISGSGSISLSGNGTTSDLSISGSGKLDAEDFVVETVAVRISGSGSSRVHATKEIDSRISGSASVRYAGDPD